MDGHAGTLRCDLVSCVKIRSRGLGRTLPAVSRPGHCRESELRVKRGPRNGVLEWECSLGGARLDLPIEDRVFRPLPRDARTCLQDRLRRALYWFEPSPLPPATRRAR